MPFDINGAVAAQDSAIGTIYDRLRATLQDSSNVSNAIFNSHGQEMSQTYGEGLGDLNRIGSDIKSRIERSAAALGLEGAVQSSTGLLGDSLAANQARMVSNRAAEEGGLAARGALYAQSGVMAANNSHQAEGVAKATHGQELRSSIFDYMAQEEQAKADIELQRLQNEAALQAQRSEAAAARQAASGGGGGGMDPMDQLDAEYKGLQIEKLLQELNGGGEEEALTQYGRGNVGVDDYFNEYGAGAGTRGAFNAVLQRAENQFRQDSTKGIRPDLQIIMNDLIRTYRGQIDRDALLTATSIYNGRSKRSK